MKWDAMYVDLFFRVLCYGSEVIVCYKYEDGSHLPVLAVRGKPRCGVGVKRSDAHRCTPV